MKISKISIRLGLGLGLLAIAIAATVLAPDTYSLYIIGLIAITTLVAVGLNVLVGLSGQISIGHAGFFAIGAYAASLIMLKVNWSFWPAVGVAIVATLATGAALAAPALRVTGPYLAMVTIAFGIIVERVLIEWVGLTGGFGGLSAIPKPQLFGLEPALRDVVLLTVGLAFLGMVAFDRLKQHPWGRALQAVRDDETAAVSLGLNPLGIRVVAFAVSAAFTGIAGACFASTVGFISPDSFTQHQSILFLLVVILGGIGSAEGALIGAIVLVILPEMIQKFADYQLLVFGCLLLLTLWLAPDGITSLWEKRFGRPTPVYPLPTPPDTVAMLQGDRSHAPLQVDQVSIQFGGIKAVDQVSLTAEPGTITAIIGPNGAGKTTLLNLISGVYPTQSGSIKLGDRVLTRQSSVQIANAGVSRTFQATRLFNALSVLDNLRIAKVGDRLGNIAWALVNWGRSSGGTRPEPELLELLSFVGYQGDVHQIAANLPFVDRRLVEMARALAARPEVLLLDEPAAGLSREDKEQLAQLIRRVASSGLKVILIEHDMELVMGISDRVLVLDSGQAIAIGDPATVQRDPAVLEAYLGTQGNDGQTGRSPADQVVLDVVDLCSGYGTLQVLQKISLTVHQGELVAVIGANGTGKSTLLNTVTQMIPAWSGEVKLGGKSLTQLPSHQMASQGLVLVPEGRQVFGQLTVIDNLMLGAFHRQDHEIQADLQAMLTRFPRLAERQHQPAGLLSGGEQQMLAIARGLMARPQVLLLDEPSLGLAPKLVEDLYETLAKLRDEGMTILLVDQMAANALAIADRAYLIDMGQIVRSGTGAELRHDPAIAQTYLGH